MPTAPTRNPKRNEEAEHEVMMVEALSIMIVGDDAERARIRPDLVASGKVRVVDETGDAARVAELMNRSHPDSVLVILNGPASLELIRSIKMHHPSTTVVCTGSGRNCTVDMVVKSQRAGASEFLMQPLSLGEIEQVVDRVLGGERSSQPRPSVIAAYSCRGGAGVTTLCVNLAVTLAQTFDKPTTIVDLDLQHGTAPLFLGVQPEASIADVVQNWVRLDAKLLEGFHTRVKAVPRLYCLASPAEVTDVYQVEPWHIKELIARLREQFSFVLIDCQHVIEPVTVEALNQADTILLVTLPDLASVYTTKRALETFKELEGFNYSDDKFCLVLNRYEKDSPLHMRLSEIRQMLEDQHRIDVVLADDFKAALAALQLGRPLVQSQPKSPLVKQYGDFARVITGQEVAAKNHKKGLLGFLNRK